MKDRNNRPALAFFLGLVLVTVGSIAYSYFDLHDVKDKLTGAGQHTHTSEVHVHSDFLFYANDERIRFTDDRYQSAQNQVLHKDMHFHDNNDEVIHRHANGVTLRSFFDSLGVKLTDKCLILDTGTEYCSNDENKFLVFVNGQRIADPANYINQEADQILFFYGRGDDTRSVDRYTREITSDACIYSGTCPDRGTPPPEACGLTCEL